MRISKSIVKTLVIFFSFCTGSELLSQSKELNYYLPEINYDQSIKTPEAFLGYQIGDWHISHDQLYYYMQYLAEKSPRVRIVEYARSHEHRPLIQLIITNSENHNRLPAIKAAQQQLCKADQSDQVDINNTPMVIYQGYSIHGNESSGSNAAALVAYYLAAGQSKDLDYLLANTVVLLDPCFNPDGLHRFSTWANSHKSHNLIADPNSRELNEPWPRGRTNHYWTDLNRDWLLLTHPESRGRLATFHEWKPSILTDHHEMGSNNTFFFQPGIPSRTNPNTPKLNQELTGEIATFHAAALDSIQSLYYTKESFDDFYYGKGSTYPDINGSVGILFEQASARGHLRETVNGDLSFAFSIRNQVVASLSTQKAAANMKNKLLNLKKEFYKISQREAAASDVKAYVFSSKDDAKLNAFIHNLNQHQIEVFKLKMSINNENKQYLASEKSYIIPTNQLQYKLIKTLFEKVTSFQDSLFYDVSAWTFPLAFDLKYDELSTTMIKADMIGERVIGHQVTYPSLNAEKPAYGYVMSWDNTMAASALYELMQEGILTKSITQPTVSADGKAQIPRGSIWVSMGIQNKNKNDVINILNNISEKYQVSLTALSSGLSAEGPTMGSPTLASLNTPRVAILVGDGVNAYDAGDAWHHLDKRMNIHVTLLNKEDVNQSSLATYNRIIIADGSYNDLSENQTKAITEWIARGGTIIAMKRAINWLQKNKLINLTTKSSKTNTHKHGRKPYDIATSSNGALAMGGSIFNTNIDLTHPLCYGYEDNQLSFMKNHKDFYEYPHNEYATVAAYTEAPLQSGYLHKYSAELIPNTAAITVFSEGSGKVICFSDNPLFRGYWWGGFKIFNNALFFSDMINTRTTGEEAHGHEH